MCMFPSWKKLLTWSHSRFDKILLWILVHPDLLCIEFLIRFPCATWQPATLFIFQEVDWLTGRPGTLLLHFNASYHFLNKTFPWFKMLIAVISTNLAFAYCKFKLHANVVVMLLTGKISLMLIGCAWICSWLLLYLVFAYIMIAASTLYDSTYTHPQQVKPTHHAIVN